MCARVTTLGGCGAWPEPGRACSGFVVEHQGFRLVLDLGMGRWFGGRSADSIPLFAPEPVLDRVVALDDPETAEDLRAVFSWHPLPAAPYRIGPFTLESVALPHHVLTAGVRLNAPGLTIAYTGDTGPDSAVVELGREADLYIVDSTYAVPRPAPAGRPRLVFT